MAFKSIIYSYICYLLIQTMWLLLLQSAELLFSQKDKTANIENMLKGINGLIGKKNIDLWNWILLGCISEQQKFYVFMTNHKKKQTITRRNVSQVKQESSS